MVAHNYRSQGKNILIMKPSIDTRFSSFRIVSRVGISELCDYVLESDTNIKHILEKDDLIKNLSCIIIDECQFLTPTQIDELRIATEYVPVICYGLRTDYMTNLFPGSKRLMELSDSIEEIKTTCVYCDRKSIINAKICNGKIIYNGSSEPDIGSEEKYRSMCWKCWYSNKLESEIVKNSVDNMFNEGSVVSNVETRKLSHSSSYSSFSDCEKQEILNYII